MKYRIINNLVLKLNNSFELNHNLLNNHFKILNNIQFYKHDFSKLYNTGNNYEVLHENNYYKLYVYKWDEKEFLNINKKNKTFIKVIYGELLHSTKNDYINQNFLLTPNSIHYIDYNDYSYLSNIDTLSLHLDYKK
jgi:hypothetical protein